jgi:hypothetical protein
VIARPAALYHPVWTSAIRSPTEVSLALAAFGRLALWKAGVARGHVRVGGRRPGIHARAVETGSFEDTGGT